MTLRDRYEAAVRGLAEHVAALRRDGLPPEAIARAAHAERRRLAIHYKDLTPEPYRSRIAARTTRVYGNPEGPSIAFLRAQGKTWEAIIAGAMRPGPPVGLAPEDG
ncbi:cell wall-binding protein [Methylobacterium sp. 17Sr1-1]|uniref:cell wall-binding protein n=1 Tax=Methylobacterium sp. 17Sr1-1 TaxID=2202826 RepID=UPI000D6F06B4|nr:cell wall-binding protein [Methylobacterium sp. 17Sr1-1]AWN55211.1 cell wall-binding protein [Methylobacterium sp. 17Sr1-1]